MSTEYSPHRRPEGLAQMITAKPEATSMECHLTLSNIKYSVVGEVVEIARSAGLLPVSDSSFLTYRNNEGFADQVYGPGDMKNFMAKISSEDHAVCMVNLVLHGVSPSLSVSIAFYFYHKVIDICVPERDIFMPGNSLAHAWERFIAYAEICILIAKATGATYMHLDSEGSDVEKFSTVNAECSGAVTLANALSKAYWEEAFFDFSKDLS